MEILKTLFLAKDSLRKFLQVVCFLNAWGLRAFFLHVAVFILKHGPAVRNYPRVTIIPQPRRLRGSVGPGKSVVRAAVCREKATIFEDKKVERG